MKNIFFVLLISLFIVSCAPKQMWNHPEKGREDIEKDRLDCQYEAEKAVNYYAPNFAAMVERDTRKNNIANLCMRNKGYITEPITEDVKNEYLSR